MSRLLFVLTLLVVPFTLNAQDAEPPMTYERLGKIVFALDANAKPQGSIGFQMKVGETPVLIVTDSNSNRMRAMVLIRDAGGLSLEDTMRMMQANFDSALDARYAVANGKLWATFIHPLSPLKKDQLISGLAQTVNIARTYGSLYSGGNLQYGGGDSDTIQRELIEDLLKKGEDI